MFDAFPYEDNINKASRKIRHDKSDEGSENTKAAENEQPFLVIQQLFQRKSKH